MSNGWTPKVIQGGKGQEPPAAQPQERKPQEPGTTVKQVGSKYVSGRRVVEIAKDVRADWKAWLAQNPKYRATQISVRSDVYSMGASIDVRITRFAFPVFTAAGLRSIVVDCRTGELTQEAQEVSAALEMIVLAYRRNEAEGVSDYRNSNFCESVEFSSELRNAEIEAYRKQLGEGEAVHVC